jgi:uncharacterized protein
MKTYFIDKAITYDGTQLRSHWIYENTELLADALVAFIGPCDVSLDHMVDLEDVRNKRPIYSQSMLHFMGEFYRSSLAETILLQRLLISQVQEGLMNHLRARQAAPLQVNRIGNDLYEGDKKISVSVATTSPTSTLIHAGINIISDGTPVLTKGLADFDIEPIGFADKILNSFKTEFESLERDLAKVRSVD